MAAPISPTLISLTTEALKKAGYPSPSASLLSRAQTEYMEEIKNDILVMTGGRKLKSLHTVSCLPTTNGQSRYSLPTDYFSDMTLTLMDGNTSGTAQAGASGTITLAADFSSTEGNLLGKEIFIYSGTGVGSLSQVTAYNDTTKVATVTPDFNTAPDGTSKYLIIERYNKLAQTPLWNYQENTKVSRGEPDSYYLKGDADYGELILAPAPYRSSAIPWGMQCKYYANLMTLDLASTLISTLYQRWRNVWIQGVKARQLENDDNRKAPTEDQKYRVMLQQLIGRETYGADLSNLQCTVSDY